MDILDRLASRRSVALHTAVALLAASAVGLGARSASAAPPPVTLDPIVSAATGQPICDELDKDPDYTDVDCNDDGVSAYYGSSSSDAAFAVVLERTPLTSTGNQPPFESTAFLVELGVGGTHRATFGVDGKETGDDDYVYVICAGAATPHWTKNASAALADETLTVRDDSGRSAGQAVRVTVYVPMAELARCGVTATTSVAPFVGTTQAGPIGNINKDFFLGRDVDFGAINTDPDAVDDGIAGVAGGPQVVVDVLGNDTDADVPAQTLTVTSVDATGTLGAVDLTAGVVRYTPPATRPAAGTDAFRYTISDGKGGTDSATVTATFPAGPVNRAPDAVDDATAATRGGGGQTVGVLGNDTDPDGDTLSVASVDGSGTLGTVTLSGGVVTYTPPAVGAGTQTTDTFRYTVSDGALTDTAQVTVTLARGNRAPVAVDDATSATRGGGGQTVAVVGNDTDADGDTLSVASVDGSGTLGTVTLSGGVVTYTPPAVGAGTQTTDTFGYTVSDGALTDTAVVTVTLGRGNRAPVAVDDATSATRGEAAAPVAVVGNDSDPDGDSFTVTAGDATGTLGTVTLSGGVLSYAPPAVGAGTQTTDTFRYTITDAGGLTASAVVTVTLGRGNRPPVAAADSHPATRGGAAQTVPVTGNDSDPDLDAFAVTAVDRTGTLGTVTLVGGVVSYAPPAVGAGPETTDSFSYTITDSGGLTDEAVVTVSLGRGNRAPVALDDATSATRGDAAAAVVVLLNDSDPDGDAITVTDLDATGALGTVALVGGVVTYTPPAVGAGPETTDTFAYELTDALGAVDTAVVTVTLGRGNRAPVALDDAHSASTGGTAQDIGVVLNDGDPDGDSFAVTGVDDTGTLGTVVLVGGVVRYTPPAFGSTAAADAFTYTITDAGGLTGTATVRVTLTRGNRPPVAVDDAGSATRGGGAQPVTVLPNDSDPDGDALVVSAVDGTGTLGTVVLDAGVVRYTPPAVGAGAQASDVFRYTVRDTAGLTDEAVVTIALARGNRPPVAVDDSTGATRGGSAQPVSVLPNDSDPDGDALTVTAVDDAGTLGTVGLAGGVVTYTPPAVGGTGGLSDSFRYTVADPFGATSSAVVTVALGRGNRAPLAVADAASATRGDGPATVVVLGNDSDPDGDTFGVTAVDAAGTLGTAVLDGGAVRYTPPAVGAGAQTTDTFRYTITDAGGLTGTAVVTVTLARGNRLPVAVDDTAAATRGAGATPVDVLGNDSDPDGDPLTVTAVGTTGTLGTVTLVGGVVRYAPPAVGASAATTDAFTYTVSDGQGGTATATVVVTLARGNRPPLAVDDAVSAVRGAAAAPVGVLVNDSDPDGDPLTVTAVDLAGTLGVVSLAGGVVTYAPPAVGGAQATDSFAYTVGDGQGGTSTARVVVSLGRGNRAPVAVDDALTASTGGAARTVDLTGNDSDPDGDTFGVTAVGSTGTLGTVQLVGGVVTYTPPGFGSTATTDGFTYTITDAGGLSSTARATVTLARGNRPPVADDDALTVGQGSGAVPVDVLTGDTDPDGDVLTVVSVTQPAHGTVTLVGGVVTYTPAPGHSGPDAFTYVVSDGVVTDTGAVSVTVTALPVPVPGPLPSDLALDKSGPGSAAPGETVTWRLAVLNKGPGAASGVTVTEQPPAGVTVLGMAGDGFTCDLAQLRCTATGPLAAGSTAVVTVTGTVAAGTTAPSVANTAVAGPADATPGDNTDTLVTSVVQPSAPAVADLVLDKAGPAEAVLAGEDVTWAVAVTNVGTGPATGFAVTDPLGDGLTLVSVTGDGFTCEPGAVVCTYAGALAPGETARLTVVATLTEEWTASSVANTATVALAGDPTPGNNSDTATTAVVLPIDGVTEEPATEQPEPTPTPTPEPVAVGGTTEQPATRPGALPFTGARADLGLGLGAGLSVLGLLLALLGRRRRVV